MPCGWECQVLYSRKVNNLSEMAGYRKIMGFAISRRVGAGIGHPIFIIDKIRKETSELGNCD